MANLCERCKRPLSSLNGHASCPHCHLAAGECNLDIENPCHVCEGWTSKQWGKLRQSLVDARTKASNRGRQHWSSAFPRLGAWILSKAVSSTGSEIASQAGEDDFEDNTLVSTPEQQIVQVLVVQAQNEVTMATGMPMSAPSTPTAALSTAPLTPVAGPSTMDSLNPISAQLGARTHPVLV